MQHGAFHVALTRMSGIIAGVVLTLLFTVTILPTAAHTNVNAQLRTALQELLTLNGLCWLPMAEAAILAPAGSGKSGAGSGESEAAEACPLCHFFGWKGPEPRPFCSSSCCCAVRKGGLSECG